MGRPNIYDLIGYGCTYVLAQVLKKAGRDLSWTALIKAWETLKDAKPSDMGGYDVIFPETVTPTDHQGNKRWRPPASYGSWRVVGLAFLAGAGPVIAEFVMIVVGGLKFGAIYALAALGIVVIHKATTS